jgi:hypothetical protein
MRQRMKLLAKEGPDRDPPKRITVWGSAAAAWSNARSGRDPIGRA